MAFRCESSMSQDRITKRTLQLAALAISVAVIATGCSGGSASSTTTGSPTSSTPAPAASSTPPTAPATSAPATGAAAGSPVLKANVCDMLAVSTISSITGLSVGPGKNLGGGGSAADTESGICLWGSTTQGVQLTAYTAANFAPQKARAQAAATAVPGVGAGAWSRGAVTLGNNKNVVLFVDYGSFGVILAVTTPTASVDTAAALGRAVT